MPVTLTYEHKRIRCGKPRCRCASPRPDTWHGPYWYAFFADPQTGKTRARYLGKHFSPPPPGPGARSARVTAPPSPGALRRRRRAAAPPASYLGLDKTVAPPAASPAGPGSSASSPARARARAVEKLHPTEERARRAAERARERDARKGEERRRQDEVTRAQRDARDRAQVAQQAAHDAKERCRRERARVSRFTPTPCEGYQRVCYVRRDHALRALVASNLDITESWGLEQKASGGEFDALNERYDLKGKGKRRVTTLAAALDRALPPGRPYCLDRIDLEALNETTPGRELGPFRLPEVVAEHKAYQSYMLGLGQEQAYRDEQQRHDVEVPF
jgi:hypothetical protein